MHLRWAPDRQPQTFSYDTCLDSSPLEVVSRETHEEGVPKRAEHEEVDLAVYVDDCAQKVEGEVYVDSSAALAVVGRKGNGKLRHIRVGHLWVQQVAEDEVCLPS